MEQMLDYLGTVEWLKERLPEIPRCGIVLGTGLSGMADSVGSALVIPYESIPGFVRSTAPEHKGNLVFGYIEGKPVLMMQGRFHYYEGYEMAQVIFPIRVMSMLGIADLIVTNASGSLKRDLPPGSIVIINDHINFMGNNPLRGTNDDALGERFPSMNMIYEPEYLHKIKNIAKETGISIHDGIYLAVSGPSLETRAECVFFAQIADVVGMSTVPEVIAARHCGIKVLAFSVVTNYTNLFHDEDHSQDEIRHNAVMASDNLKTLLRQFIYRMPDLRIGF